MVMNKLYTIALVIACGLVMSYFAINAKTACAYGCGIRPIPPIGCSSSDATCICSSDGDCQWVFVGCG